MKKPFQFKQFAVQQEKSAMKIGTDGVLLGAWAAIETAETILDIGTGTGVIALMCAQRNPNATITAIEIDRAAAEEASLNFKNSPWANRLSVHHTSLQNFNSQIQFNHIICNPPFFESNEQLSGSRQMARQHNQLNLEELASTGAGLLHPQGQFSIVYPFSQKQEIIESFKKEGLHLQKMTEVHGRLGIPPKRILTTFGFKNTSPQIDQLFIELNERHQYSADYIALTKAFYLKM